MAWEKERDKWLEGNIPPKASREDVERWIRQDPIWERADKVVWNDGGSHFVTVYVRRMSRCHPSWKADKMTVSHEGGRHVKKWIVEALVKGYLALRDEL